MSNELKARIERAIGVRVVSAYEPSGACRVPPADALRDRRAGGAMSAHTPGPWEVARSVHDKGRLWVMAVERPLCNVAGDEAEANARLLAAAPDLLSACEAGRAFLSTYNQHDAPEDVRRAAFDLWRSLNDAAIAKARGVES